MTDLEKVPNNKHGNLARYYMTKPKRIFYIKKSGYGEIFFSLRQYCSQNHKKDFFFVWFPQLVLVVLFFTFQICKRFSAIHTTKGGGVEERRRSPWIIICTLTPEDIKKTHTIVVISGNIYIYIYIYIYIFFFHIQKITVCEKFWTFSRFVQW